MNLTLEQHKEYIKISERTWGCTPFDINWAINTNIYKQMEEKLLWEENYNQSLHLEERMQHGLNDLYCYTDDGFCDGFTKF
jgi:hypothetical protein